MKISLCGAGGTGKTTLLEEINKTIDYPVIEEGIREWLEYHAFDDFKEMTEEDIKLMQNDVMYSKINREISLNTFISDRTTIDNATYALRWIASLDDKHQVWYKNYLNDAVKHANDTYDVIFFLPVGVFKPKDDGLRSNKLWYQYMMQCIMESLLSGLDKPLIHYIKSSSLQDRVDECFEVMNGM